MPVVLVIVSILLVTATRLRRRCGACATSLDEGNGRSWLSALMARGSSWRAIAACLLLLTGLAVGGRPSAQTSRPLVYVVPIEGMIDLGLAPFLARTIREAAQAGAAAVVLDINTLGGRVDAAIVMRDALLQARVRTIAFVNPRAISAGALLALATETIVMSAEQWGVLARFVLLPLLEGVARFRRARAANGGAIDHVAEARTSPLLRRSWVHPDNNRWMRWPCLDGPYLHGHRRLTFSARGPLGPWPTVNETVWPSRSSSNGVLAQAD